MFLPEHLSIQPSRSYLPLPVVLCAEGEWEGGPVVRELASPVARYLFGMLRDVMLWLMLPPQRRREAFSADAIKVRLAELGQCGAPADVTPHLINLLRICNDDISQDDACTACLGVAVWARGQGALQTELAFRQAAALARVHDATLSLATARLAREASQHRQAETWFRRTIKVARQAKDWNTYVRAYLGLGMMYYRLGNGPAAKAVMERGLRAATRWRLRQLAGEAHHDLFHVLAPIDLRQAYQHARSAEVKYRDAPPELLARLAGDVATIWVRVGAGRRAFSVFESVIPHADEPGIRAVWAAQLLRCAATSGLSDKYEALRGSALSAISESPNPWRRAEAQLVVSWADLAQGEWERASMMANNALTLAVGHGLAEVQSYAEIALADAEAKRREGARGDALNPDSTETPSLSRFADSMAGSICEAVAAPRR